MKSVEESHIDLPEDIVQCDSLLVQVAQGRN